MKTKFGTALALSAVLLTGTAAAAINTQALTNPTDSPLGTGSTTLLPVDQVASVDPIPVQSASPEASATDVSGSNTVSSDPGQSGTTTKPTKKTSKVTGSPKPSKSESDDDDEDEDYDEEDDD